MKNNIIYAFIAILLTVNSNAQFKMNSAGNIGLGTTTPATRLHVAGNSTFTATPLAITSAAYIRGMNTFSTPTTPDFTWYNNDQVGFFHPANNVLGVSVAGQEKFRVVAEGIEINAPTAWTKCITVKATNANSVGYHMRYNNVDNFYVHASGYLYSQGMFLGSDERIKKNIQRIEKPMEKLNRLNGVTYNWNYPAEIAEMNTDRLNYGFVAQNVEEVIPSLVITATNGYKAVNYDGIIPLLVECVKDQSQVIEDLKAKLDESNNYTYYVHSSLVENAPLQDYSIKTLRPNPADNMITVEYSIPGDCKSCEIRIFDMTGVMVQNTRLNGANNSSVIDISQLQNGTHMVSLIIEGKVVAAKRLVVAH